MEDNGTPLARISYGLRQPVVGIPTLSPLHLQVQPGVLGQDVGRVWRSSELLATAGVNAEGLRPSLGSLTLAATALGP